MEVYQGAFGSWSDVCREFQELVDLPDEVLLAAYDTPAYEGYADVIYRQSDRYYWVHGSHCSCYGLEGQWAPEQYSSEQLIEALRRGDHFWWAENSAALCDVVIGRVFARFPYVAGHA